jgi:predicted O-linked N-acetylglucosamine transferase (SPINDLY family)
MHITTNRLLVFARKPAPVQITWLSYPGTTGLWAMDYRLTDPHLDPPGQNDAFYSETSVRLPDAFWCYDPLSDQPEVNDLPALQNGYFTLGCLNNFCKINDGVLASWAKILWQLPHSRLLLHAPPGSARDHVLGRLRNESISPGRVEFIGKQPRADYLGTYHRIDLCMDPWPCNGGTTSLDALWMGVPFITLVGNTTVGRAGWSLLCNLKLPELAARTPDEYVSLAVRLAGDLPRLRELRASLRARLCASPLMDAGRFARNIEQAYRQMWRAWCGNLMTPVNRPAHDEAGAVPGS